MQQDVSDLDIINVRNVQLASGCKLFLLAAEKSCYDVPLQKLNENTINRF